MERKYILIHRDGHNEDLEYEPCTKDEIMVILDKFVDDPQEAWNTIVNYGRYYDGSDEFWLAVDNNGVLAEVI